MHTVVFCVTSGSWHCSATILLTTSPKFYTHTIFLTVRSAEESTSESHCISKHVCWPEFRMSQAFVPRPLVSCDPPTTKMVKHSIEMVGLKTQVEMSKYSRVSCCPWLCLSGQVVRRWRQVTVHRPWRVSPGGGAACGELEVGPRAFNSGDRPSASVVLQWLDSRWWRMRRLRRQMLLRYSRQGVIGTGPHANTRCTHTYV